RIDVSKANFSVQYLRERCRLCYFHRIAHRIAPRTGHRYGIRSGRDFAQNPIIVAAGGPLVKQPPLIAVNGYPRHASAVAMTIHRNNFGGSNHEGWRRRTTITEGKMIISTVVVLQKDCFRDEIIADGVHLR